MRRSLLGLTLTVGVLFLLGATPAVSSAANCTYAAASPVDRSFYPVPDWFHVHGVVSGCSGVDKIRFYTTITNAGIYDVSWGQFWAPHRVDGALTFPNPVVKGVSALTNWSASIEFDMGCW